MIYIESALITILICLCVYATVTDLKYGIITNKSLKYAAIPCIALNLIYYSVFTREYVTAFLFNLAIISTISVLFYSYHIWAAGDSKLLIMILFALPARIFYFDQQSLAPTLTIIIIIFSVAYVYLIGESIVLGIKQKDLFRFKSINFNIVSFLKQYALCMLYIIVVNEIWSLPSFLSFYENNIILVMIVNLFVIMTVLYVKIFSSLYSIGIAVVLAITVGLVTSYNFIGMFSIKMYIAIIFIVLLRVIAEKYNYRSIPTKDAKAGMVLAWPTIIMFKPSRVKGLPDSTTEDIRSKITETQAANIHRWETSRYGNSEIIIVRKIPFAIFIAIGTFIFIVIRMCLYGY